ncbi:MAG TPA: glycosyltransferase family 4 protein [Bacteroidales bacterium]|nr:glycosyltransferase family 4 protein [Bacteroidales bacterium]
MKKVCHLTSVHQRDDIRIFHKECKSLQHIYEICLVVADGRGDDVVDGINIYDVGKPSARWERMILTTKRVYKKALMLDADIYHFHDPELIPIGLKLLKKDKKVIYDVHEDVPKQLLSKPYLNKFILKIISNAFKKYENKYAKKFTAIITVVPEITNRLRQFNDKTVEIRNYPKLNEFAKINVQWKDRENAMVYIGSISEIRGIYEMMQVAYKANIKLHLAGNFSTPALESDLQNHKEWQQVIYHGVISRDNVVELLSKVKIGLLLLHPVPNHLIGLNTKIFEYLAAGLPIIASDMPHYKEIIEVNNCGFCINPFDIDAIVEKVKFLIDNDQIAEEMSLNGRNAIDKYYNWQNEEVKLIELYNYLLNS